MHADLILRAEAERLSGNLSESMQHHLPDLVNRIEFRQFIGLSDFKPVSFVVNASALRDNMQRLPVIVGGKKTDRGLRTPDCGFVIRHFPFFPCPPLPLFSTPQLYKSRFFWQTDRGERAFGAEFFVCNHGRSNDRRLQLASPSNRLGQQPPSVIVNLYADGLVVGVIANAAFGNGLPRMLFDQGGVGDDLELVAPPRRGLAVHSPRRPPAFVLVRYQPPVAPPDAIHLADNSPLLTFELQGQPFAFVFVALDLDVKPPPGINTLIGDAQVLDVFQVKEPLAISERVQRVNSKI